MVCEYAMAAADGRTRTVTLILEVAALDTPGVAVAMASMPYKEKKKLQELINKISGGQIMKGGSIDDVDTFIDELDSLSAQLKSIKNGSIDNIDSFVYDWLFYKSDKPRKYLWSTMYNMMAVIYP